MSSSPTVVKALALVAVLVVAALLGGCAAHSSTVRTTPVWSAEVPDYGVRYSRTTNVFPFYSRNVTAYSDRVEESGNAMLFISWSRTTVLGPAEIDKMFPRVKEDYDVDDAPEADGEEPLDVQVYE